jgi:hypothetical protein
MKKRYLIPILVILISTLITSCDFNFSIGSIEGNGNVIKEERFISGEIHTIKASSGIEVELVERSIQSVFVEADENLLEHIETRLSSGILTITSKKNIGKAASKKVVVGFISLDAIEASSGANIKAMTTILADKLSLKNSSGSSLEVIAIATEITAQASSGSRINLTGQSRDFDAKASSGSSINAKDLITNHCKVAASSGADIIVNVGISLDAKASSGGNIKYYSEPKIVNKNNSSSGSVRKM